MRKREFRWRGADRRQRVGPPPRRRPDRGQTAIEYLGWIPILLLVALAAIQLGIAVYAVQQAGTAARAAARTYSMQNGDAVGAGKAAISDWLADGTEISPGGAGVEEVTMTARVAIPSVVPGIADFGRATRSATMPVTDR
ncbi:pilus assembly protein [Streptomyces sp. PKU-MA01144]|uniref:TadE/TadG family type IV pilus assembly protein n=1 Tax=Streptomyces TaxID=1883 RepID=UPI00147FC8BC|nr:MULTISPECIES: TadE/TadG family type IV pilus assembly protein [Streptomyces]MCY0982915.1 pilus assembly protein [Streptomyces tirandamycinicus]NNJ06759.1 pilus assembly protein [Streptomyces sp. PKU-MA01144]